MKWRSSVMPPLPTKWPRVMSGRKREGEEEETAPLLACLPPSPPNEGRKEEGGRIERGAAGGGKRRRERERERERETFFLSSSSFPGGGGGLSLLGAPSTVRGTKTSSPSSWPASDSDPRRPSQHPDLPHKHISNNCMYPYSGVP